MSKNKRNINKKRGFSLIEVLITLFLFSFGLVTIGALMLSSTRSSMGSRDQIVASMLAQEGVELIQNLNDKGEDITADPGYSISYDNADTATDLISNGVKNLYVTPLGGYVHTASGNKVTKYSRKIEISYISGGVGVSGSQMQVKSVVKWNGATGTFPATCNLANKCVDVTGVFIVK